MMRPILSDSISGIQIAEIASLIGGKIKNIIAAVAHFELQASDTALYKIWGPLTKKAER